MKYKKCMFIGVHLLNWPLQSIHPVTCMVVCAMLIKFAGAPILWWCIRLADTKYRGELESLQQCKIIIGSTCRRNSSADGAQT